MQDEFITVFFNKRTGSIKELCSGEQDMSWFGNEEEDYTLIYDFIRVDSDPFIFENYTQMQVVDGSLKLIQRNVPDKYI